ncbi:MAG TPA: hypothetical protein VGC45_04275 [Gryllotalpicola sp.]
MSYSPAPRAEHPEHPVGPDRSLGTAAAADPERPSRPVRALPRVDEPDDGRALRLVRGGHVELYRSSRDGELIKVMCDCELGIDHTFAEWIEILGDGRLNGPREHADSGELWRAIVNEAELRGRTRGTDRAAG